MERPESHSQMSCHLGGGAGGRTLRAADPADHLLAPAGLGAVVTRLAEFFRAPQRSLLRQVPHSHSKVGETGGASPAGASMLIISHRKSPAALHGLWACAGVCTREHYAHLMQLR